MKIGIRFIKKSELNVSSCQFEFTEDAELTFRDEEDKPKSVELFIFTKNPISSDKRIIRLRPMVEYKGNTSDIQIIEDDGKECNYVYTAPGEWQFDIPNNIIEFDNGDLKIIKDYLSKYDL